MHPTYIQEATWTAALADHFIKPEWIELQLKVQDCYTTRNCFPQREKIFRAFTLTPLDEVKVVILGQDPYHGVGQANGLSFSVEMGRKIPPSLRNILKEVMDDTAGMPIPDLSRWAEQGVFLLNSVLTVEEKKPGSHAHLGWEKFTNEVITIISNRKQGVVFMLWGQYAQKKEAFIDSSKHLILKAPHPSPLSAHQGFMGCRHFSKANHYLMEKQHRPIQW